MPKPYRYTLTGFKVGFYLTRIAACEALFAAVEKLPMNGRQYLTIEGREYVIERRDQKGE